MNNERLLNEAATLKYIKENTNIPVPQLYACFEDDDAVVLVTEFVKGVGMHELDDAQREIVKKELQGHIETLQNLKSSRIGGPRGIVIPPYRALLKTFRSEWNLTPFEKDELVFCHNDLSQQNVKVDPETLKSPRSSIGNMLASGLRGANGGSSNGLVRPLQRAMKLMTLRG
jgi:aminoglycoside phosphotransferase (APT) family kinase protein